MEGFVIYVVIGLVAAYVCWRIAERKGRSGALWAVIGFVVPIIGLILIAVMPPAEPTAD